MMVAIEVLSNSAQLTLCQVSLWLQGTAEPARRCMAKPCAAVRSITASNWTPPCADRARVVLYSMRRGAFGMAVFGPQRRVLVIPSATILVHTAKFHVR